jgi:hypothetical protein
MILSQAQQAQLSRFVIQISHNNLYEFNGSPFLFYHLFGSVGY